MCLINDLQITGSLWDANGDPSAISVEVRANGCAFLEFKVFRTQSDSQSNSAPLYSEANRPVSSGGLASAEFAVTTGKQVHCGEVLWIEVQCQTDPRCFAHDDVLVVCKGFEGAECPSVGPALAIQPALDSAADCVAGGTYTVTLGGTWPSGTTFNWSLGNLPPGVTSPTNEHGASFVLQHPLGSPGRILIAEVEVPGCPDVQSVVVFPPADVANCPTQIAISVLGPTGPLPVPADGTTYDALAPGDYRVRVTSPTGADVDFEWYRDNALQPSTPMTPNELAVTALSAGTETTVAVRVQQECCNALLDTVVLRTTPKTNGDPNDPPTDPSDPENPTPPVVEPPAWPCLILGFLVGIAMIAALVTLVTLAIPPLAVLGLQALVIAAIAILIAGILLLLICRPSICRILRIIAWSLKWAIVLGALIAIASMSFGAFLVVLIYGMFAAATVWLIAIRGCREPTLLSIP